MKHELAINKMFELLYEPWMNEEDKAYIKTEVLKQLKVTMEQLDEELEIGVKNGYPIEFQLELIRRILKKETL